MLREYLAAERLNLTVEIDSKASPLKTKVEPADAGEERCNGVGQVNFSLGSSGVCPYLYLV